MENATTAAPVECLVGPLWFRLESVRRDLVATILSLIVIADREQAKEFVRTLWLLHRHGSRLLCRESLRLHGRVVGYVQSGIEREEIIIRRIQAAVNLS